MFSAMIALRTRFIIMQTVCPINLFISSISFIIIIIIIIIGISFFLFSNSSEAGKPFGRQQNFGQRFTALERSISDAKFSTWSSSSCRLSTSVGSSKILAGERQSLL